MKERKKTVSFVMFAENYTEHFIFPGILERLMSRWEKTVLKRARLKAIPREELSPIRWNSIRKISTEWKKKNSTDVAITSIQSSSIQSPVKCTNESFRGE